MFKSKLVTLSVVVVATLASQTFANPITFLGTGLATDLSIRHDGSNMSVRAGQILIDYSGTPYTAYCVDLDNWIKSKWSVTEVPVTTVSGGLAAAYLYDHFAGSVTTATEAAGLQIAIWEVVDDFGGTLNLSNGDFRFSGSKSVSSVAQNYLNALPTSLAGYKTSSFILQSGSCPRSQNLIVPEPASLVLLVSALPLFLSGRRR